MVAKLRGAYELVLLAGPPPEAEAAACAVVAAQADAALAALPASAARGREGRATRAAIARLPVPALGSIGVSVERWVLVVIRPKLPPLARSVRLMSRDST